MKAPALFVKLLVGLFPLTLFYTSDMSQSSGLQTESAAAVVNAREHSENSVRDRLDSGRVPPERGRIPLWIKIPYTLFVCLIVPVYWVKYGPGNFLWFSDIALLTTLIALWLESRLLAGMMAVAVLLPELAWNIDFFGRLIFGAKLIGLSGYMFDPKLSLFLRALSLFHIILPALLLWMIHRLGYDERAWVAQTLLAWAVLPVSYLLTDPSDNVNWVYGFSEKPQTWMPAPLYLALLMIIFPLLIYAPTHLLLKRAFG